MQGIVVSRSDLFGGENDVTAKPSAAALNSMMDFVEVEFAETKESTNVDQCPEYLEHELGPQTMEFQLFSGIEPTEISLAQPKQESHMGRPLSHYIFRPDLDCRRSYEICAVSGESVLREADFWLRVASKRPVALDINSDFSPKRRKCRPGKTARLNKKIRNKSIAQEESKPNYRTKMRKKALFKAGRTTPKSFGKPSGKRS